MLPKFHSGIDAKILETGHYCASCRICYPSGRWRWERCSSQRRAHTVEHSQNEIGGTKFFPAREIGSNKPVISEIDPFLSWMLSELAVNLARVVYG
jgi:hypothetical protein